LILLNGPLSRQYLLIMLINPVIIRMLEAKCPHCGKKAEVDDELSEVKCSHCGFVASYDVYIEIMKGKAVDIADNFQMSWDRNPF
jgi:Zn finger protein HypA/HybF involved in hydrogenase expression